MNVFNGRLFFSILLFISLPFVSQTTYSQEKDADEFVENRDSAWGFEFDLSELDFRQVKMDLLAKKLSKIKQYNDSMLQIIKNKNIKERSDSLEQLFDLLSGDISTSYNAYSLFFGQFHSQLSALNKGLKATAFPTLNETGYHYTNFIDFTWKRKRIVNEVFIATAFANEVSKGNVTVSYSYLSPLNYCFGYALIDSKRLQFFPFAGLAYQASSIKFSNSYEQLFELGAGLYDSLIKSTLVNKKGVDYLLKKREIVLSYGLELDFHLFYSKRKTGLVVGLRAGKTLPVLSSGWRLEGKRYAQLADVTIRDYYVDFVVRIYTRRNGKRGTYNLRRNWWED